MGLSNKLTKEEWHKVFQVRCRSKLGQEISREDRALIEVAYRENPERYAQMSADVFAETVPFGAAVQRPRSHPSGSAPDIDGCEVQVESATEAGAVPVTASTEFEGLPRHETELLCLGTYYGWTCTCGTTSRHMALMYRADRNAKAHVRKAKREAKVREEQPSMGAPGMGAPGMGAPGMGAPGMGAPGMGAPGMGDPGMGDPSIDAPGMGAPGIGAPGIGAPGIGAPGTDEPQG